jgi:hypothetical protein
MEKVFDGFQPERKLDVLVAVKWGWTQVRHNNAAWYGRPPGSDFSVIDLPKYTADSSFIFQIASVAKSKYGLNLDLQEYADGWKANFWNRTKQATTGWHSKFTTTPQEAVCLAFVNIKE